MIRKERRRRPRVSDRGAALRREIAQLKRQSAEIILRMDEIVRELGTIEAKATVLRPRK